MANHVTTVVQFHQLNDAGLALIQELYSRIRPSAEDRHYEWFGDIWGLDKAITDKYDWTTNKIGPNWCYFEDKMDDQFVLISAWSPPVQGLQWLFDRIAEVDNDFIASVQYDDEGLNFYGAQVYTSEGVYDEFEDEYEELVEDLKDSIPEIKELFTEDCDEDEVRESDEFSDLFSEHAWEYFGERQYNFIQEILECIHNDRNPPPDE